MLPFKAIAPALFGAACVLAACGSSSNPTSSPSPSPTPSSSPTPGSGANTDPACVATTSVALQNFAFSPNCITIAANQNVTFTNQDSATHTATSDTGAPITFDSGDLAMGASFQQSFAQAAGKTVTGFCKYHTFMKFKVVVGQ